MFKKVKPLMHLKKCSSSTGMQLSTSTRFRDTKKIKTIILSTRTWLSIPAPRAYSTFLKLRLVGKFLYIVGENTFWLAENSGDFFPWYHLKSIENLGKVNLRWHRLSNPHLAFWYLVVTKSYSNFNFCFPLFVQCSLFILGPTLKTEYPVSCSANFNLVISSKPQFHIFQHICSSVTHLGVQFQFMYDALLDKTKISNVHS